MPSIEWRALQEVKEDYPKTKSKGGESLIQDEVLGWLRGLAGVYPVKIHQQSYYVSTRGIADILCCWRGIYLAIELKTPKGRQSGDQKRFERNVKSAGGVYLMPRSLKQLQDELKQLGLMEVLATSSSGGIYGALLEFKGGEDG